MVVLPTFKAAYVLLRAILVSGIVFFGCMVGVVVFLVLFDVTFTVVRKVYFLMNFLLLLNTFTVVLR